MSCWGEGILEAPRRQGRGPNSYGCPGAARRGARAVHMERVGFGPIAFMTEGPADSGICRDQQYLRRLLADPCGLIQSISAHASITEIPHPPAVGPKRPSPHGRDPVQGVGPSPSRRSRLRPAGRQMAGPEGADCDGSRGAFQLQVGRPALHPAGSGSGVEVDVTAELPGCSEPRWACRAGSQFFSGVHRRPRRRTRSARSSDDELSGGRHLPGICVGLQLLLEPGIEHDVKTAGSGEWPGRVERLQAAVLASIGWNTVEAPAGGEIFTKSMLGTVLFLCTPTPPVVGTLVTYGIPAATVVSWTVHEKDRFVSAVGESAIPGDPVHPEKSGDAEGVLLLRNSVRRL